ncbi:hypothetical protein M2451_000176 [Dysgonomonas sp. PFB1-18]|uniref:hypothetical protein n=1 Tax=unclassified Dysgonomonas TaxID=2630389 RepID=UPI002475BF32|nr:MULTISPECIES: hypothetical protein [unclassified Dysgonomonas]MDH6307727.1 hypothetical protein [Dysgonomonas sp. PF1-14]MDH6337645.1 hypothetical protein [Dysgonomonas sp. PF1-16]MDH6378869.1 hypothetical protein [Dysgonomonas sp. PFB1-18]MDH6396504.1 hypothetical protein [Dysgonomonas sp. PF1-23]
MKFLTHFYLSAILLTMMVSCSEELKLYHEPEAEPPKTWIVEKVNYPEKRFGLIDRNSLVFSYDDEYQMTLLAIPQSEEYKIDKLDKDKCVSYSKSRESGSTIIYDSILVKLDAGGRAMYSRHVTYKETNNEGEISKERSQNDSVHFTYDAAGYLILMQSYSHAGDTQSRYEEEYVIENGNIKEISTSKGVNYTYTYDDTEYEPVTKYAYEMPLNTQSLKGASCILVTNLVYISDYIGKSNKNNVLSVVASKGGEQYAELAYAYTFDEYKLVSEVKISGTINNQTIPDDYITTFTYAEKTQK